MDLLERASELAALAEAREAAAQGHGRVVLVSGEPGIGKTSLVATFVQGLGESATVLWGTCDDLAIPRPLGAIRDLSGAASRELEVTLSSGAGPQEIQSLLLAELELSPRPAVLVLEDVHWADEATLDVITFLGRRCASLPALLVLTFRGGEVPPSHPLHAALGAAPSGAAVFLELEALSPSAVAALAGEQADAVYALTGGEPVLRDRVARRAARLRAPGFGRDGGPGTRVAPRRRCTTAGGARLGRPRSRRHFRPRRGHA